MVRDTAEGCPVQPWLDIGVKKVVKEHILKKLEGDTMANEASAPLIRIGPKGGAKKDGFNLVTENVTTVNVEAKQIEVELLAYDGKTVLLDVAEDAIRGSEENQNWATGRHYVSLKKTGNAWLNNSGFVPKTPILPRQRRRY